MVPVSSDVQAGSVASFLMVIEIEPASIEWNEQGEWNELDIRGVP